MCVCACGGFEVFKSLPFGCFEAGEGWRAWGAEGWYQTAGVGTTGLPLLPQTRPKGAMSFSVSVSLSHLPLRFFALPAASVRAALHLAAAATDHDSVKLLLSSGANPSIINSCGLSPGACFLRAPDALAAAGGAVNVRQIRQTLREHRERFGHVRRLADTSTKRVAVEAVGDRATVAVHRFVEFALKVPCRAVPCFLDRFCFDEMSRPSSSGRVGVLFPHARRVASKLAGNLDSTF